MRGTNNESSLHHIGERSPSSPGQPFRSCAKIPSVRHETNAFELVDNKQNFEAAQGAGIQSAETVARLGAKALVTGIAAQRHSAFFHRGIQVLNTDAPTVAEALAQFREGRLTESIAPDVEGHWG